MEKSKALVSQALLTLKDNIDKASDPLGFTSDYWSEWAGSLDLPKGGETILYTGRMYQMLPFVIQTTQMVPLVKPFLGIPGFAPLARMGNQLAGEPLIRMKAKNETGIRDIGKKSITGILAALESAGIHPGYLYEEEPYSGVLLYDLGLESQVLPHVQKVCDLFRKHGVRRIITVDPHTTFMLKKIYPEMVPSFDVQVFHYTQLLPDLETLPFSSRTMPREFVIHDSCVMTRDLAIIDPIRNLARTLGVYLIEPENSKENTGCCGGPVEYAFGDLCHKISRIRIKELAQKGKDIITACPICLINLRQYEKEMGVRIWDLGEIIYQSMDHSQ